MRLRRQLWIGWTPVVGWMGLIFFGSTDVLSAAHTSRFIEPVLRWMFQGRLSAAEIDQIHFFIRKLGHLCEYAVLAVLAWNAIRLSTRPAVSSGSAHPAIFVNGWALFLAALYAAGDEFHQSFVPSRGANVHDVLIDTAGACGGLLIWPLCRRIRRRLAAEPRRPDKS